eukprot:491522_1
MEYKQYNDLDSYPIQYQQRERRHQNCIVDFQMDVAQIHKPSLKIVNGPASQQLGQSDRNYIQQEIVKRWNLVSPDTVKAIPKQGWDCLLFIFIFLTMCIIGLFCLFPYMYYKNKKGNALAIKWRDLFIRDMQDFIHNELKIKYPNLTFTLIYPVVIYGTLVTLNNNVPVNQRPMASNVWCYIRVSNGPLPLSDSYEPTIDSTDNINVINNNNNTITMGSNQNTNYHSIGGAQSNNKESALLTAAKYE